MDVGFPSLFPIFLEAFGKWRFPELRLPLNESSIFMGFSITNDPALGVSWRWSEVGLSPDAKDLP